jgi:hypothetical protein
MPIKGTALFLCFTLGTFFSCLRTLPHSSKTLSHPIPESFDVVSTFCASLKGSAEAILVKDRLYPGDTIEILKGHLILTDQRGGFLEFDGDTIFLVSEIINNFQYYGIKAGRSISIDQLYSQSEPFSVRAAHAVMDGPVDHGISISFPPSRPAEFSDDQMLCLQWKSIDGEQIASTRFRVVVKNIFDEVVGEFEAIGDRAEINPTNFRENLIVVQVIGSQNPNLSTKPLGIAFLKNASDYAVPCEADTALEHFCLGLTFESEQMLTDAKKHYELATLMSTQPFYQIMFDNFKNRNGI